MKQWLAGIRTFLKFQKPLSSQALFLLKLGIGSCKDVSKIRNGRPACSRKFCSPSVMYFAFKCFVMGAGQRRNPIERHDFIQGAFFSSGRPGILSSTVFEIKFSGGYRNLWARTLIPRRDATSNYSPGECGTSAGFCNIPVIL